MEYGQIRYEVSEGILTITLNRPDRLNAFTEQMGGELIDAFDCADADDAVRAIVVTGAGRGYCAGADLSSGGATFDYAGQPQGIDEHRDGGGLVALRIFELKKPIIAAINGPAVGVGVTMTLPMDVRLASTNARFGFVFARRGIVPEACSSWFLPRVVGISQALEWTYSGRVFAADEASPGGWSAACSNPMRCCPPRMRSPARSPTTPPLSPSPSPAPCCGACSAPITPWPRTRSTRNASMQWVARRTRARACRRSWKAPPRFSMRPSNDMPAFYPWWPERKFRGEP
jgi:hypothetical protein